MAIGGTPFAVILGMAEAFAGPTRFPGSGRSAIADDRITIQPSPLVLLGSVKGPAYFRPAVRTIVVSSVTVSSAVCRSEKLHAAGQTVTVVDVTGGVLSTKAAGSVGRSAPKTALTTVVSVPLIVHGPVPLHPAPLQPENTRPSAGVAVSVTTAS